MFDFVVYPPSGAPNPSVSPNLHNGFHTNTQRIYQKEKQEGLYKAASRQLRIPKRNKTVQGLPPWHVLHVCLRVDVKKQGIYLKQGAEM
jgi:hypothetical protein